MAQTKRDKQIKRAMSTRSLQIAATKQQAVAADAADSRRWWGRGSQPRFCYCTRPVTYLGERGWASWVGHPYKSAIVDPDTGARVYDHDPIFETVELHKTRKAAKARAWNLWQGWRLGQGLSTTWRTYA